MLIVCPNCATSYTIDPASVGAAGRAVRCARCKTTWFAQTPKLESDVDVFVDSVIAEAEAQSMGEQPDNSMPRPTDEQAPDDFGGDTAEPAERDFVAAPAPSTPHVYRDRGQEKQPENMAVDIIDAPPLVPSIEHAPLPQPADTALDGTDVETFAARRSRLRTRRKGKSRTSRWTAVILVLFAFNVALIGARSEVVRYFPQTASLFAAIGLPVNLRSLKFEDVKISREDQDGAGILIVDGTIVSIATRAVEVPRLRFAARNATGQEIFTWSALPDRSILQAGETLKFSSRLAAPPPDAVDVVVRFLMAQDLPPPAKK